MCDFEVAWKLHVFIATAILSRCISIIIMNMKELWKCYSVQDRRQALVKMINNKYKSEKNHWSPKISEVRYGSGAICFTW